MKIFIPGEFTTCNDFIAANNRSKFEANTIKQDETMRAKLAGLEYINLGNKPIDKYPVQLEFLWFRKDDKTDPGNIAFAEKYITDGLVLAGILKGDTWKCIKSIAHEFEVDKFVVGVQVWMEFAGTDVKGYNVKKLGLLDKKKKDGSHGDKTAR